MNEFLKLPAGCRIENGWISFQAEQFSNYRCEGLKVKGVEQMMTLQRFQSLWMRPMFGNEVAHDRAEVLYFLFQKTDGTYGLLLPLLTPQVRSWIKLGAEPGEFSLEVAHDELTGELPLLYVRTGSDPYKLTKEAMQDLSERLGTFRMRTEKEDPEFADLFGWCTWDAFYRDVSAEKVIAGLEAFKEKGMMPPFVILDDGWQEIADEMLYRFEPNEKFPDGLKPLVDKAKNEFGVKRFGVWHTLQGYWFGTHPKGPLADVYKIHDVHQARVFPIPGKEGDDLPKDWGLIDRADVARFYQDYYAALAEAGVDTVKVDNQGATEDLIPERRDAVAYVSAYQEAFQTATEECFGGSSIHCMSHSTDVFYALKDGQVMRNSDDYFPARDESHGHHIHCNGMNNLWTSTFCLPDWDMFHSNHFTAEFHAASRAISGGPIYISDVPANVNLEVIKKLCTDDGRNLRCDQPAQPARDCLFVDCLKEEKLFKITNTHRGIGILGLFNCREPGTETITEVFSVADIPGMDAGTYAVYFHRSGTLQRVEAGESLALSLDPLEYELVTFSPVVNGIAPIGWTDKFNSSWVLDSFAAKDEDGAVFRLRGGGPVLLYAETAPAEIRFGGENIPFSVEGNRVELSLAGAGALQVVSKRNNVPDVCEMI